jgi:hypothetical protein
VDKGGGALWIETGLVMGGGSDWRWKSGVYRHRRLTTDRQGGGSGSDCSSSFSGRGVLAGGGGTCSQSGRTSYPGCRWRREHWQHSPRQRVLRLADGDVIWRKTVWQSHRK